MTESVDDPMTQYKLQLATVEESLKTASDDKRADLLDLREKLTEVIILLQGSQAVSTATEIVSEVKRSDLKPEDEEFLRFQMEISELEKGSTSKGEKTEPDVGGDVHHELHKVLSSMEGSKCRAPFIRQWGEKAYHNAIILSTDLEEQDLDDLANVQVKVMFCNPLCDEMKPCPYFLDGHCKFDQEKCRYSHGYGVKYSELEEYVLPDYSNVQRDSKCLAKYKDGLWYTAVIENCLTDNKYFVKYDNNGSTDTLAAYDILPLEGLTLSDDDEGSSSDSSCEESHLKFEEKSDLQNTPTEINYMTEIGSSPIGLWEQHTKGIASKLMAKMGYVWGQGLGKNSDGRIDPVEAIVLPKGKSLDHCVAIRESTGPVSVEDKFNAEKVKEQQRVEKMEKNNAPEATVFDFLNKNILAKSGKYYFIA
ncbi:zinc finger CCCH-type with G patch domain-containing protein-like [Stegodyphus dumicola]|uniref:zinc finger CCCH-type with G patch domain-containing protein-like n=1 Tax=Stegodyphus dumicola TaxID=202533 RepID=UPI0015AFF9BB|nr:zinc finger CCCH-type with G patch domain-containing protein-like [Stegodyphus dumicola]